MPERSRSAPRTVLARRIPRSLSVLPALSPSISEQPSPTFYTHQWSGTGALNISAAVSGSGATAQIAGDGGSFAGTITTSGTGGVGFASLDFSSATLNANVANTILSNGTN